jgi:hypothetical protein
MTIGTLRLVISAMLVASSFTVLSACCGGSSGPACSATIQYKGRRYTASSDASDSKSDSTRLACRKYCKTDDPVVNAAYVQWKASPEGARSPSSREQAVETGDALQAVNHCQGKCIAEMVLHPELAKVTCK